jgi:phosphoribosylformylglycinamidine synthase
VIKIIGSPNQADKSWVTDQYDRYVRGNSVLAQPENSGMLRIDEDTNLGVALATDCNARYAYLDPYAGAQLALAEAYRNVAITGARPLAVSDCLNFGSPEDPDVMWQFERAIVGLVDGCRELGTPVTGGNVSFYNQTGDQAILPTPVIGVLGLIDDVSLRTPTGFVNDDDVVLLLGETRDELAGSAWAGVIHDHLGGLPPKVDLDHEKRLAEVMVGAAGQQLLTSAHDLSEGGLAQALVESVLRHDRGATITLPADLDPFVALFSESTGRVVVSLPAGKRSAFVELCAGHGISVHELGAVGGDALDIAGLFAIGRDELRASWVSPIRKAVLATA